MDKRWKNLGLFVLVVIVIVFAYYLFSPLIQPKPVIDMSLINYDFNSLVGLSTSELDSKKILLLQKSSTFSPASRELSSIYVGIIDLLKSNNEVDTIMSGIDSDTNLCGVIDNYRQVNILLTKMSLDTNTVIKKIDSFSKTYPDEYLESGITFSWISDLKYSSMEQNDYLISLAEQECLE